MNDVSDLTKYDCDWGAISCQQFTDWLLHRQDYEDAVPNLTKADLSGANLYTGEQR